MPVVLISALRGDFVQLIVVWGHAFCLLSEVFRISEVKNVCSMVKSVGACDS